MGYGFKMQKNSLCNTGFGICFYNVACGDFCRNIYWLNKQKTTIEGRFLTIENYGWCDIMKS